MFKIVDILSDMFWTWATALVADANASPTSFLKTLTKKLPFFELEVQCQLGELGDQHLHLLNLSFYTLFLKALDNLISIKWPDGGGS